VSISGIEGSLNVWRAEGCNEWEDEEFLYVSHASSTLDLVASNLNLAPEFPLCCHMLALIPFFNHFAG
jgi:hypothetical protein